MGIFDLKTLLSEDERKEYDAAEKRIIELGNQKNAIELAIDNLREGIVRMNLEMSKRLRDEMMKRPTQQAV